MAQVIVVTSGKGGVGKTTTTAALGAALALQDGQRVAVIDFDVGLRNLDLVMGAERRVVYDLTYVAQGNVRLSQALIRDKRIETLYLLAASQTRDKDALTEDGEAFLLLHSVLSQERTSDLLVQLGLVGEVVDYACLPFETSDQIARVEGLSDAYHLRVARADVMVGYLVRVTRG